MLLRAAGLLARDSPAPATVARTSGGRGGREGAKLGRRSDRCGEERRREAEEWRSGGAEDARPGKKSRGWWMTIDYIYNEMLCPSAATGQTFMHGF